MNSILVTGGAGFIGSHTVERLLQLPHPPKITILDSFNDYYSPKIKRQNINSCLPNIQLVESDLCDETAIQQLFLKNSFDAVIHLAARAGVRPSILNPKLYIDTNIIGTHNLLSAAQSNGVNHFIFASSSSVYGVNQKIPFAEDDPILQTISPYAMTKMAGEQMCSNYSHLYGMKCVCLRFFTVYGPRQRPDLAISKFTQLIDQGKPIDKYGNGATARDYTYVHDIVNGIVGSLQHVQNLQSSNLCDIINLGGAQTVTLNEMITTIEDALGKKALINLMPEQPGDVPLTSADVTKAKQCIQFNPTHSFQQGIKAYVQWYRDHQN
jgi:UDP-glucuronate 4-epimerase